MGLQEPWFSFVRNGVKTVEGRIYDEKRRHLEVGDKIEFSNGEQKFKKTIEKLMVFENFEKALRFAKLSNILPGIKSYYQGVLLYRSIPGYEKKEKIHGVLLIFLENNNIN